MVRSGSLPGVDVPAASWGEFVVLPENGSAVGAVRRLVRSLTSRNSRLIRPFPLMLHGPTGTGKSLLLQTAVKRLTAHPRGLTARQLTVGDLGPSLHDDPQTWDDWLACDWLAIEDIQHLPAKSANLLCRLLDQRGSRRRVTVLTSTVGPAGLTHLPQRCTSRLAGGLVVGLEAICAESRRHVLDRLLEKRGLNFTEAARDRLVAIPTGGGLRALVGRVEQLAALHTNSLKPVDEEEIEALLAGEREPGRSPIEPIIRRVAAAFEITPQALLGASRQRQFLLPRQVAMYLAREIGRLSLPRIAANFGGRDHTTVLHACRKVEESLQTDMRLQSTVRQLRAELS